MARAKRKNASKRSHQPFGRHFRDSLLSFAAHKHTAKHIHPRHSSHGVLIGLLLLVGAVLFPNLATLEAFADQRTISHQTKVTATVMSSPPTEGARITFPGDYSETETALQPVRGTCPAGTSVSLYRNGLFVGSTACMVDGTFSLTIQLSLGSNILQAQNYDQFGQTGPATNSVRVLYRLPSAKRTLTRQDVMALPTPPLIPCLNVPQQLTFTDELSVGSVCIVKKLQVNEQFTIPLSVFGGMAPYALSIDWGDDKSDLSSIPNPTRAYDVSHVYNEPGIKRVVIKVSDQKGQSYYIELLIEVSDTAPKTNDTAFSIDTWWFTAPIPLYWLAVAITVGFWMGDLFDRYVGRGDYAPRKKRTVR